MSPAELIPSADWAEDGKSLTVLALLKKVADLCKLDLNVIREVNDEKWLGFCRRDEKQISIRLRQQEEDAPTEGVEDSNCEREPKRPSLVPLPEIVATFCHELAHLQTGDDSHGRKFYKALVNILKVVSSSASKLGAQELKLNETARSELISGLCFTSLAGIIRGELFTAIVENDLKKVEGLLDSDLFKIEACARFNFDDSDESAKTAGQQRKILRTPWMHPSGSGDCVLDFCVAEGRVRILQLVAPHVQSEGLVKRALEVSELGSKAKCARVLAGRLVELKLARVKRFEETKLSDSRICSESGVTDGASAATGTNSCNISVSHTTEGFTKETIDGTGSTESVSNDLDMPAIERSLNASRLHASRLPNDHGSAGQRSWPETAKTTVTRTGGRATRSRPSTANRLVQVPSATSRPHSAAPSAVSRTCLSTGFRRNGRKMEKASRPGFFKIDLNESMLWRNKLRKELAREEVSEAFAARGLSSTGSKNRRRLIMERNDSKANGIGVVSRHLSDHTACYEFTRTYSRETARRRPYSAGAYHSLGLANSSIGGGGGQ